MKEAFTLIDSLLMRYRVSGALPPDTITRFIVRHHTDIASDKNKRQMVWRRGVLLTDHNGSEALITEGSLSIDISIKGTGAMAFMGVIKNTFDDIFNGYKCDDQTLEYAVDKGCYLAENVILSKGDNLHIDNNNLISKESILKKIWFFYNSDGNNVRRSIC